MKSGRFLRARTRFCGYLVGEFSCSCGWCRCRLAVNQQFSPRRAEEVFDEGSTGHPGSRRRWKEFLDSRHPELAQVAMVAAAASGCFREQVSNCPCTMPNNQQP